ncbi:integrase [Clostridium botulinum]|nr:integrase [Clostridium botulinum]QDY28108.1 integrase [Clostridium botulinum]
MFFNYIMNLRNITVIDENFAQADLEFIKPITLHDMYSFISYCQKSLNSSPGTRARKIVSIRQFWKYLKTKAHLIDNNIAEELETPKLPKRIPKYLNLEESVRLLLECKKSPRDHCIITIFLNCALRLSELTSLNIDQVYNDILTVVGKGNKERTVYLNKACIKTLNDYLNVRKEMGEKIVDKDALFLSKNYTRINKRSVEMLVKKYVKKAGLDGEKYSPHKLRHSATCCYLKRIA